LGLLRALIYFLVVENAPFCEPHHLRLLLAESSGQLELAETEGESLELSELDTFTNYSVSVAAFTRAGKGPLSRQVFCSTREDGEESTRIARKSVFGRRSSIRSRGRQGRDQRRDVRARLLEAAQFTQRPHPEVHRVQERGGQRRGGA